MVTIDARPGEVLFLGYQGEKNIRRVAFDMSKWLKAYGSRGTVEAVYRRPGDETPYALACVRDGNTVYVTVSEKETNVSPHEMGKLAFNYYVGDTIVTSERFNTCVNAAFTDYESTVPSYEERFSSALTELLRRRAAEAKKPSDGGAAQ